MLPRPATAPNVATVRAPVRAAHAGVASATSAPTPSSQTRVKVEKYAEVGDTSVWWIDQMNEATETTVSSTTTASRGSRCCLPRRVTIRVRVRQPSSSSGHTT